MAEFKPIHLGVVILDKLLKDLQAKIPLLRKKSAASEDDENAEDETDASGTDGETATTAAEADGETKNVSMLMKLRDKILKRKDVEESDGDPRFKAEDDLIKPKQDKKKLIVRGVIITAIVLLIAQEFMPSDTPPEGTDPDSNLSAEEKRVKDKIAANKAKRAAAKLAAEAAAKLAAGAAAGAVGGAEAGTTPGEATTTGTQTTQTPPVDTTGSTPSETTGGTTTTPTETSGGTATTTEPPVDPSTATTGGTTVTAPEETPTNVSETTANGAQTGATVETPPDSTAGVGEGSTTVGMATGGDAGGVTGTDPTIPAETTSGEATGLAEVGSTTSSPDQIDGGISGGDADMTEQMLKELEKQNKVPKAKTQVTEYASPPDYEFKGRGLVYNCVGKHWACVDGPSYRRCEDNSSSLKFLKKKTECYPFNVYETQRGCESMQNRMVSSSAKTEFCDEL